MQMTYGRIAMVVLALLTVSNIWQTVRLRQERANLQKCWAYVLPEIGAIAVPLMGFQQSRSSVILAGGGKAESGPPTAVSFLPNERTILLVSKSGCRFCADMLPKWQSLVERARRVDPHVRVAVVDLYRQGAFDEIDERIKPDVRLAPTTEAVRVHRLYQAPMTAVVSEGRYREVVLGVANDSEMEHIIETLSKGTRSSQ